jgi:hypothetical protein
VTSHVVCLQRRWLQGSTDQALIVGMVIGLLFVLFEGHLNDQIDKIRASRDKEALERMVNPGFGRTA